MPNFGYLSVNRIHSLLNVPKETIYNSTFFCNIFVSDFLKKYTHTTEDWP
jgi:hypothetical protein